MDHMVQRPTVRWTPAWWGVLLIGLGLWIATIVVAEVTDNALLLPTIVMLGSFLVPVTAVVWYLDHDPSEIITPRRVISAFVIGGVVGVLAASLLESWLLSPQAPNLIAVGLIEEFVKGLIIVFVALGLHRFRIRDGMVLGATVGFGFAAFESSGYALASLFVVHNGMLVLSVPAVIFTELIRGVLAPFGHGLWSALLGGMIFRAANIGKLRVTIGVLLTYLGVSLLHAAFDSFSSIAGYIVISILGVIPLIYLWRRAGREQPRVLQPVESPA
jgi:RsiW-degrading membrane proteinase PrsW (M82 family)